MEGGYKMIYIIMMCTLIGSINSELGISIAQGIKLNAIDIIFILFFIYEFIVKKRKLCLFNPIKWILIMFLFMSIGVIGGLFNGGQISSIIRILRNIVYILVMFFLTYSIYTDKKSINISKDLIVFSWIAIINCLLNVLMSFKEYNWFIYYRENANFQVFMFVFLLLYKDNNKKYSKKAIFRAITIIFLGICIFLSQERLQILAVVISLVLKFVYNILCILRKKEIKINISAKKIVFKLILLAFIAIILVSILKIDYVQNYINYFIEYRIGSIFNGGGFNSDASLDGRMLQINNIINRDWIYYLFGSGTGSVYLSAIGYTHIVDGMWLWIFKDTGIIGILLLFSIYLSIIIEVKKVIYNKSSIAFGLIAILVLQIFTPNIMLGISDSVFIGYILALICLGKSSKIFTAR